MGQTIELAALGPVLHGDRRRLARSADEELPRPARADRPPADGGIALFVIPRASTAPSAAGHGVLFGLVMYAFTDYSTLRRWPFVLMLADVAWGAAASVAAVAVRSVVR